MHTLFFFLVNRIFYYSTLISSNLSAIQKLQQFSTLSLFQCKLDNKIYSIETLNDKTYNLLMSLSTSQVTIFNNNKRIVPLNAQ